jgi:hypothetical protein
MIWFSTIPQTFSSVVGAFPKAQPLLLNCRAHPWLAGLSVISVS